MDRPLRALRGAQQHVINIIGLTENSYRNILRAVIVAQLIANIAVVAQLLSQCGSHVAAMWSPALAATTTCQSPLVETYFGYVQSSVNSVCDLALTIIPLLVVKQLHLSTRTKFGLLGLLCLSLFAFVASLIKAISVKNLAVRNNFSYNMAFLTICCTVENNLVVIGASIPTLKPLLRALTGQNSSDGGKYYDQNPSGKETAGAGTRILIVGSSKAGKRDEGITCKTDIVVHEEDIKEEV